jgi:ABC-type polysaccharide/polyol phosphate transport system ATPase subunit
VKSAITFDNITKDYRGASEYRALRDELASVFGRRRARKQPRKIVRALANVSFDIAEGESFGIIGMNGAGKTTALKLATRIAYPTSGRLAVRGRVGALIEVGTGMHPELTGRENVSLYGRILGLTRRDVESRFADIVDFAGIGAAIDQPVKQYSSGMQLRLGFAVAAHLEPDILLVDEAIAVGDAGFQYRCVERMSQLVREGRTLVFVSHDMSAIETLCRRAIVLSEGAIAFEGSAREAVAMYLNGVHNDRLAGVNGHSGVVAQQLEIVQTSVRDSSGREVDTVAAGEPMSVRIHYNAPEPVQRPIFNIGLVDGRIGCFALASMLRDGGSPESIAGDGYVECTFEGLPLLPRVYEIWCGVRGELGYGNLVAWQRLRLFRVTGDGDARGKGGVSIELDNAPVKIPYSWSVGNGSNGHV